MSAAPDNFSPAELPCAKCGYDLRMQPREGICPECATPVQKAIELAAVPVRPPWRDSDPRWRRRMIAGAWAMLLVPLMDVLWGSGLTSRIPVIFYNFQGYSVGMLQESFVTMVYTYLAFCIAVVLFFSKERFRRRHPLDWTRRWGVILSYVVLLVSVVSQALVIALVMIGIAALFMTLPHAHQPAVTGLLAELGSRYIRYGPHGSDNIYVALAAFSACAVLLACVPIYDALRSSGPKRLALVILAPIALICVWIIGSVLFSLLYPSPLGPSVPLYFFEPRTLLGGLASFGSLESNMARTFRLVEIAQEAAKWLIFLIVALWLTAAQVRAWRKWPPREVVAP